MTNVYWVVRLDTESWLGPIHGHAVQDVHEAAYFLTQTLAALMADRVRTEYANATACQITMPELPPGDRYLCLHPPADESELTP